MNGMILNVKRFEIHDGPGMRTTLFLKGCPLRCKWCHNPESQRREAQLAFYRHKCVHCGVCAAVCPTSAQTIAGGVHRFDSEACIACGKCAAVCPREALVLFGRTVSPLEILPELLEDKVFFDSSGGGVTVSGGEPLMQPAFTAELFRLLRENGVHTALDTCLYASREALDAVLPQTDLLLVDLKAIDPAVHKKCTGASNESILDNLRYVDRLGKPYEIRIPYIPGENDGEIEKIAAFIGGLKNADRVKLLAYHDLARTKYAALGADYEMGDRKPPTADEYEQTFALLQAHGIHAIHK